MNFKKTNENPSYEKSMLLWHSVLNIISDLDAKDSQVEGEHVNRVTRHYNQLLSNLNVPDLVAQMFQSGKLTAKELEHLQQFHSTPIRASEELLNIVIMKPRDVYECFLELLKTKQHHVYQMLISDNESVYIDDQSMSEHCRLIRQNYTWLTEKLDPDSGLLATLYAKKVLSHREYVQFISDMDQYLKNEILLSIISRKSVEDFKKFMTALIDTKQERIISRLKETPVGVAKDDVTTTVSKALPPGCSGTPVKKMSPQIPPKRKIPPQPPTAPSTKQNVVPTKSSLESELPPSKPNRTRMPKDFTQQKIVKSRSVVYLEAKLREIQTELQIEISAKVALTHRKTSKSSIWTTLFTEAFQEILRRESDCKRIKEDIQRQNAVTTEQLTQLYQRVYDLQKELNSTTTDNKTLSEQAKISGSEVKSLKQEANEKASAMETLKARVINSEMKFRESEAQLRDAKDKFIENESKLKSTATKLEETQEKLKETETTRSDLEAELIVTKKCIDNLTVLIKKKEQEVNEQMNIEKFKDQTRYTEEKVKELEKQLENTREKLKETETAFKRTAGKLKESEEKITETEANLSQCEAKLTMTEKDNGDLRLEGSRERCLNLEQKLELERTKNDRLKEMTQEYKRKIDALLQQKYKSDPVLVETISTNSGKKKKLSIRRKSPSVEDKSINGLTILDKELFVVRKENSEVEVYDSFKFSFSRRWNFKELIRPMDMGSCSKKKCLYIFDYKGDGQSKEILRVDPTGKLISKWSTGNDDGWGLSVTNESNVILSVYNKNKLNEYSPDGQLIREIKLSSIAGFESPWHAIKLANGHYVVSHSDIGDDLHRVCVVDLEGKLKKSFGGKAGSVIGQLNLPFYLSVDENGFVMVADQENSRVLLLDQDLEFKREILSKDEHGLRRPWRILLDESNGRLFVADNELDNQRILIFDFK